jgi:energy-converting hydrogenase Eha subunit H
LQPVTKRYVTMKKVVLFLLLFLSIVGVVSQGVVHKINWKIGYVAAYGVGIMLGLVALTLFGYGVNRLLKRRRADV